MLQSVFLTKSLTVRILFSTTVRAVVVAKIVILGILFLTSFTLTFRAAVAKLVILSISILTSYILALRVVSVDKLVISGILSSIFLISASNWSTLDFKLAKLIFSTKCDVSTSVAIFKSVFVA